MRLELDTFAAQLRAKVIANVAVPGLARTTEPGPTLDEDDICPGTAVAIPVEGSSAFEVGEIAHVAATDHIVTVRLAGANTTTLERKVQWSALCDASE